MSTRRRGPSDWAKQRIHEAVPGRLLRAVLFTLDAILMKVASIRGVVSSRTGGYHDRVRVVARPTRVGRTGPQAYSRASASVDWAQGLDGPSTCGILRL